MRWCFIGFFSMFLGFESIVAVWFRCSHFYVSLILIEFATKFIYVASYIHGLILKDGMRRRHMLENYMSCLAWGMPWYLPENWKAETLLPHNPDSNYLPPEFHPLYCRKGLSQQIQLLKLECPNILMKCSVTWAWLFFCLGYFCMTQNLPGQESLFKNCIAVFVK